MTRAQLRAFLIEWLDDNHHFGDAEQLIQDDDMSFMENGILDSMGFVSLIVHLEDHFSVTMDRKDISRENFDSMNKILDYMESHPQWATA